MMLESFNNENAVNNNFNSKLKGGTVRDKKTKKVRFFSHASAHALGQQFNLNLQNGLL